MNALVPVTAMTVSDVERVANAIAKGGLFGSKDPNAVLTLCLLAQAEGQHPAVVFRDYHVINGRPAKKAEAMLRDFINAGGKVEWHQLDDDKADATFSHPSGSARITWDHARAQKAQIAGNAMYKKYPRQMLRSRVISEGIRTVYPGATSGLYEEGEVASFGPQSDTPHNPQTGEVIEGEVVEDRKRKLDGPYATLPKLETAIKAFVQTLANTNDFGEFNAWMQTEEVVELEKQAMRDLPSWWETGEGMPEEFVPVAERIHLKKRILEDGDSIHPRPQSVLEAG